MEWGSATSGEWSGVKSTDWDLIAVGGGGGGGGRKRPKQRWE